MGVLLLDKPPGKTSFSLVPFLRRLSGIATIGHAGTLDPFATGVMVMLIGKPWTRLSSHFLSQEKEYLATVYLGVSTDTYDPEGTVLQRSSHIPTLQDVHSALEHFQGEKLQTPPMFSAKKVQGKKLYELARKGLEIERKATPVWMKTTFLSYSYPLLDLQITCSKGTYVRSIAHELGTHLGCGAHLSALKRTRSGSFHLRECISLDSLTSKEVLKMHVRGAL